MTRLILHDRYEAFWAMYTPLQQNMRSMRWWNEFPTLHAISKKSFSPSALYIYWNGKPLNPKCLITNSTGHCALIFSKFLSNKLFILQEIVPWNISTVCLNILAFVKQERLQSNIKGTMKVLTWLSIHLCLAQRLVELVHESLEKL